eukprot:158262-Chlamydomonas_euryale.AAC.1
MQQPQLPGSFNPTFQAGLVQVTTCDGLQVAPFKKGDNPTQWLQSNELAADAEAYQTGGAWSPDSQYLTTQAARKMLPAKQQWYLNLRASLGGLPLVWSNFNEEFLCEHDRIAPAEKDAHALQVLVSGPQRPR